MTYTDRPIPANDVSERNFRIGAAVLLALALILRVIGARGDLWIDEVTSVVIATKVERYDQIFWKIGYDNNHMLNTLWLCIVGPHASPFALRAFSIGLGVATVAAFGAWGKRQSRVTGLVAMALSAVGYLLVNYGSEARGYSGLALCMVLAALTVEDILAGKRRGVRLCLVMLTGFLFHMYMGMMAVALFMAFAWTVWKSTGSWAVLFKRTIVTFLPPAILMSIAALPVVLRHFGYGSVIPFSWTDFVYSFGTAAGTSLTIPWVNHPVWYMLAAIAASIVWFGRQSRQFRPALYLAMIVIVPLALAFGDMPNIVFPRYLMIAAIGVVMLAADMIGSFYLHGGRPRMAALGLLTLIFVGDAANLSMFYHYQRGHYRDAVDAMTAAGPTTYTVELSRTIEMIDHFSHDLKRTNVLTPKEDFCKAPAEWFVADHISLAKAGPWVLVGPTECRTLYADPVDYPAWGLSDDEWIVYRRKPR